MPKNDNVIIVDANMHLKILATLLMS